MKHLLTFALLSALALTLSAQEKKAPGEHSMTGCLQKGAAPNSYMLDNVEGNGPKSVGVVSSTANLAPHVGHKIEITGVMFPLRRRKRIRTCPKHPIT